MEMEGGASGDWKTRIKVYESVQKSLREGNPQTIAQLQTDLMGMIGDVFPNCQLVGLAICDSYFKIPSASSSLNYPQITKVLLEKSFNSRQQNADAAKSIISRCVKADREGSLEVIISELSSKSPKIVTAVLTILEEILPMLTLEERESIPPKVSPLLENPKQPIRKQAAHLISLAKGEEPIPEPEAPPPAVSAPPPPEKNLPKSPPRAKSPPATKSPPKTVEVRKSPKSPKRKSVGQNSTNIWSSWVTPQIMGQLTSAKWQEVTSGMDLLRKQFDLDTSQPSAIAYGLSTVFIGRTFTPKVMTQIIESILFYIRYDATKVSDDSLTAITHFVFDKIQDKHLEEGLFELLDNVCEYNSAQSVFQSMNTLLSAKNPALPARALAYFHHCFTRLGKDANVDLTEVIGQIKPLCSHSDASVRKSALECVASLASLNGEEVLDDFKSLKKAQIDEIRKSMKDPFHECLPAPLTSKPVAKPDISVPKTIQDTPKIMETKQGEKLHRIMERRQRAAEERRKNEEERQKVIEEKPNIEEEKPRPRVRKSVVARDNLPASVFPQSVISFLTPTSAKAEISKSLNEIITSASEALSTRGSGCLGVSDVSPLLLKLRPWFVDSNSPFEADIARIVELCLQLLTDEQICVLPDGFLDDIPLILNNSQRSAESSIVSSLTHLCTVIPHFAEQRIFASFDRLSGSGKANMISLLNSLSLSFDVESFAPFIASLAGDQSEEIWDSAKQLIAEYLKLPNAQKSLDASIAKLSPSKKEISSYRLLQGHGKQSFFKKDPVQAEKTIREASIDPYITVKMLNGESNAQILAEYLQKYEPIYFSKRIDIESVMHIVESEPEKTAEVIDIIEVWFTIQIINGEGKLVQKLHNFLAAFSQFSINRVEFCLITPIVLDNVGRGNEAFFEIQGQLSSLFSLRESAEVINNIISISTSVYVVSAACKALLSLSQKVDLSSLLSEFRKSSKVAAKFLDSTKSDTLSEEIKSFIEYADAAAKNGPSCQCPINDTISGRVQSPSFLIYVWIADLSSEDNEVAIHALKSITSQLKSDPSVLKIHLDAFLLASISRIHSVFTISPPPTRLCKYLVFSIFSLLNDTPFAPLIGYEYVEQLVHELISRICNGVSDEFLNQVLNALIVKLIEDCTLFSFRSLIKAIGEYEMPQQFSEKWIRLALKCFDACGLHIVQSGNAQIAKESLTAIEGFIRSHKAIISPSTPIESKVFVGIQTNAMQILCGFDGLQKALEESKELGPSSALLQLIRNSDSNGHRRDQNIM